MTRGVNNLFTVTATTILSICFVAFTHVAYVLHYVPRSAWETVLVAVFVAAFSNVVSYVVIVRTHRSLLDGAISMWVADTMVKNCNNIAVVSNVLIYCLLFAMLCTYFR